MGLPHAPFGFVMCSTEFRTREIFETDNSPFSRGLVQKFFQLHDFSEQDVKNTLLKFFNNDDTILDDHNVRKICSYLV